MRDEHGDQLIQPFRVLIVEAADQRTVEIEHTEQALAVKQRHDDLRVRSDVARNVTRKLVYVRHDDRLALLRRDAANAFAERDAHASRIALEWTKHELFAVQKIKAGPVHVGQRVEQQRAEVCGVRDQIVFALQQAQKLHDETRVQFCFLALLSARWLFLLCALRGLLFGCRAFRSGFALRQNGRHDWSGSSVSEFALILITTDFETGVLLFSATFRTGTKTFASGK